jgi:hypothetical protein
MIQNPGRLQEALATAIIEQGTNLTRDAFLHVCQPPSPALDNLIQGVFIVTDLPVSDKTARTPEQLTRGLAEFNSAVLQVAGLLLGLPEVLWFTCPLSRLRPTPPWTRGGWSRR